MVRMKAKKVLVAAMLAVVTMSAVGCYIPHRRSFEYNSFRRHDYRRYDRYDRNRYHDYRHYDRDRRW